ncbi:MAG TPA: PaaI family thioesterase [Candidatus Dormibacteraeota bacterium]|nr:PaaI family thioesterase [Candidatus Dormibacteraeota bacterium]
MEVEFDGRCFGCGPLNEDGLQMTFLSDGEVSVADFEVPSRYQSWKGVVHGGIVALLLDEAVGWAAWHRGHPGVTGKLEVRYRQPLRIGERIRLTGRVEKVRRSLVYASATINRLADGEKVAEATATLMEANPTVDR